MNAGYGADGTLSIALSNYKNIDGTRAYSERQGRLSGGLWTWHAHRPCRGFPPVGARGKPGSAARPPAPRPLWMLTDGAWVHVQAHPAHDVIDARTREKYSINALRLQRQRVLARDDTAAEHAHVGRPHGAQRGDHGWE